MKLIKKSVNPYSETCKIKGNNEEIIKKVIQTTLVINYLYKSIPIRQNKNHGKHKSQIRDFGCSPFPEFLCKTSNLNKAI